MRWYFRRTDQTEAYFQYSYSDMGYEYCSRTLIYWTADKTTVMYDPEWIEKGKEYPEKEIKEIFDRCVVKEGFPEERLYCGINTAKAVYLYSHDIRNMISRIPLLQNKEAGIVENGGFADPNAAVRELIEEYTQVYQSVRKTWSEFREGEAADSDSVFSDPEYVMGVQPAFREIFESVRRAMITVEEKLRLLSELEAKIRRFPLSSMKMDMVREYLFKANTGSSISEKQFLIPDGGIKPGGFSSLSEWENNDRTDSVNFTILAPKAAAPDTYGQIDLHMYTDSQRAAVDKAIEENDGLVKEITKNGFDVCRETAVTARLESADVEIMDPEETRIWKGRNLNFDFQFLVPKDYDRNQIAFTCYMECNGIPVTRLHFITMVSKASREDMLPSKVTRSDFRKAFISYSRRDEERMLSRVLGIRDIVPEMKFWLDKQSMDAGDLWREEIRKAITISDVLLLFWSLAASQSREVEKEWRYALEQKGLSFIAPVPLDPPEDCPPPEALSALNFNVRAFSKNEFTEKLSFYNADNIELL